MEGRQKLPRLPYSVPESPSSIRGGTDRGPSGTCAPSHDTWLGPRSSGSTVPGWGQNHSPRLLSSYRFKSSPFKELISDLSSLIF